MPAQTVQYYREAARVAQAARDAATDDEVRLHHERAWAAYFTAANHMAMLPHYTNQATAARRMRMQLKPLRHASFEEFEEREKLLVSLAHMEAMPQRHRDHAERWGNEGPAHTAAALKAAARTKPATAAEREGEAPAALIEGPRPE